MSMLVCIAVLMQAALNVSEMSLFCWRLFCINALSSSLILFKLILEYPADVWLYGYPL